MRRQRDADRVVLAAEVLVFPQVADLRRREAGLRTLAVLGKATDVNVASIVADADRDTIADTPARGSTPTVTPKRGRRS